MRSILRSNSRAANAAMSFAAAVIVGGLATAAHGAIVIGASAVNFTDISTTGTSIGAIGDDTEFVVTGAALTTAGFAGNDLVPNGVSLRIGNNGGILIGTTGTDTFTTATDVGAINHRTPLTMPGGNSNFGSPTGNGGLGTPARQFIMPLWDDYTPGTGGSTRWQVISGDLYIQWTNEDHFNATGAGVVTFEAVIRGGTTIASGNSLMDFVYNDTLFAANQYQDDGGSSTIGFKNWAINGSANDVEFGTGGGGSDTALADPAFGDPTMRAKVAGWAASNDATGLLPHSVTISGLVPEPTSLALLGLGATALVRRRRA